MKKSINICPGVYNILFYTPEQTFIDFFNELLQDNGEIHNLSSQEWKYIIFLQICEMS